MSKHADIKQKLRNYRNNAYAIHELLRQIKENEELIKEINTIKAIRYGDNPRVQIVGTMSDPVYATYINEIERYNRQIQVLHERIRLLREQQTEMEEAFTHLNDWERAIIRMKYVERRGEEYIRHVLLTQYGQPTDHKHLWRLVNAIYEKLPQNATKCHKMPL